MKKQYSTYQVASLLESKGVKIVRRNPDPQSIRLGEPLFGVIEKPVKLSCRECGMLDYLNKN